jgi:aspartate carbamoyltransferase catalytic subunit
MSSAQNSKSVTASNSYVFSQENLTGVDHLSKKDIEYILDYAETYKNKVENKTPLKPSLSGKVIFNLFFENSTRTRVSFELAAKKLGAEIVNFDFNSSSVNKGESFLDTILTLEAMKPDGVIIRHSEYGAPEFLSKHMNCPIINAGDSWREHPTQALLDALTIREKKNGLNGLKIAICGDIAHSRVASSNIKLLSKMGAHIHLIAPTYLLPEKIETKNTHTFDNLEDGLKDCDIVMTLRIQKERMEAGLIKSDIDYFNSFGITHDKLKFAKKDAFIMHPGPMNRGIEIADDVADDPDKSLILDQVANGVYIRMAILNLLIGSIN